MLRMDRIRTRDWLHGATVFCYYVLVRYRHEGHSNTHVVCGKIRQPVPEKPQAIDSVRLVMCITR